MISIFYYGMAYLNIKLIFFAFALLLSRLSGAINFSEPKQLLVISCLQCFFQYSNASFIRCISSIRLFGKYQKRNKSDLLCKPMGLSFNAPKKCHNICHHNIQQFELHLLACYECRISI